MRRGGACAHAQSGLARQRTCGLRVCPLPYGLGEAQPHVSRGPPTQTREPSAGHTGSLTRVVASGRPYGRGHARLYHETHESPGRDDHVGETVSFWRSARRRGTPFRPKRPKQDRKGITPQEPRKEPPTHLLSFSLRRK